MQAQVVVLAPAKRQSQIGPIRKAGFELTQTLRAQFVSLVRNENGHKVAAEVLDVLPVDEALALSAPGLSQGQKATEVTPTRSVFGID